MIVSITLFSIKRNVIAIFVGVNNLDTYNSKVSAELFEYLAL